MAFITLILQLPCKQKILLNSYSLLKHPLNFCDVKILSSKKDLTDEKLTPNKIFSLNFFKTRKCSHKWILKPQAILVIPSRLQGGVRTHLRGSPPRAPELVPEPARS